jgi:hypothetical protein
MQGEGREAGEELPQRMLRGTALLRRGVRKFPNLAEPEPNRGLGVRRQASGVSREKLGSC